MINKPKVDGKLMLIVAVIGLICNLIMAKVLHSGPGHSHSHGGHGGHGGHADHNEHSELVEEKPDDFKIISNELNVTPIKGSGQN